MVASAAPASAAEPAYFPPPPGAPTELAPAAAAASSSRSPSLGSRPTERDARAQLLTRVLLRFLRGFNAVKHGRRGWPHERLVWLDTTGAELCLRWGKSEHGLAFPEQSASVLRLGEVRAVQVGRSTEVLRRSGAARREGLYFSILGAERSLDLEVGSEEERNELAAGARRMVEDSAAMQAELMRLFQSKEWVPEHLKRHAHARGQDGSDFED